MGGNGNKTAQLSSLWALVGSFSLSQVLYKLFTHQLRGNPEQNNASRQLESSGNNTQGVQRILMMNSRLVWGNVCNWMAAAFMVSVLAACGGGAKSTESTVNATVESVGTAIFGQSSTFKITGNNLRSVFVGVDPFNADRCTNLTELIKTNTEIVFQCIPNRLSVQFEVYNSNGVDIKSVVVTIPEPTIKFNSLSLATTPKLGGTTRLNIDGDMLRNTINLPTSEHCLEMSAVSLTTTRLVVECIPTTLDIDIKLTSLNNNVIGTKTINLPTNTEKKPLALFASGSPVLNGTKASLFYTDGYLENAFTSTASVPDSQCSNVSRDDAKTTAARLVFSCIPKITTALFDIKKSDGTLIDTLPMPVKKVRFDTTSGIIDVALNADKAPITVKNFLLYVHRGYYTDTFFHRVVEGFVDQAGGFTTEAKLLSGIQKTGVRDPITLESTNITGLSNTLNTIAMARTSDPDSATSQFFFNAADNSSKLDYPSTTQPGYAVFGSVVSGSDVIQTINKVTTTSITDGTNSISDVPASYIVINSVTPVVESDNTF